MQIIKAIKTKIESCKRLRQADRRGIELAKLAVENQGNHVAYERYARASNRIHRLVWGKDIY